MTGDRAPCNGDGQESSCCLVDSTPLVHCFSSLSSYFLLVTGHSSLIATAKLGAEPEPIYIATAAGVGTMALDISDDVIAGEPGAISSALRSFTQLIKGIH